MSGPEHFAAIAHRHFARLKELTMTATAQPSPHGAPWDPALDEDDTELLSARDHYQAGCELLVRAKADAYDMPASHRLKGLAETHGVLGLLAVAIWPAPDPVVTASVAAENERLREELRHSFLEENQTMARELARLLPVAQAARRVVASPTAGRASAEFSALAEAVAALEDGQ